VIVPANVNPEGVFMRFKVFVQAGRPAPKPGETGPSERMVCYEVDADDSQAAAAIARQRFELEHGIGGWVIEGIGTLEMP
jgi:hypothetical protein